MYAVASCLNNVSINYCYVAVYYKHVLKCAAIHVVHVLSTKYRTLLILHRHLQAKIRLKLKHRL